MTSKWFLMLVALWATTALFSCKKKDADICRTPSVSDVQGTWQQDYHHDATAFQPRPAWERLEFRNDSFYLRTRIYSEALTALNCNEFTWLEYSKGAYEIKEGKIYFNGIITDSSYIEKVNGCHKNGASVGHLGITYCNGNITMQVLDVAHNDTPIPGEEYKVSMYKVP